MDGLGTDHGDTTGVGRAGDEHGVDGDGARGGLEVRGHRAVGVGLGELDGDLAVLEVALVEDDGLPLGDRLPGGRVGDAVEVAEQGGVAGLEGAEVVAAGDDAPLAALVLPAEPGDLLRAEAAAVLAPDRALPLLGQGHREAAAALAAWSGSRPGS